MTLTAHTLTLTNFRSYRQVTFDLAEQTVLFGPNTAGKTNLLEALYLLASGKSFRADRETEMIHWGETAARVAVTFERNGDEREAVAKLAAGPRMIQKTFTVDNTKLSGRNLGALFPMVLFSADDTRLVDGSPGRRRRALDLTVSQGSPGYGQALRQYSRVLASRNRLLEQIAAGESGPDELEFWDEQLIAAGQIVVDGRRTFFEAITKPLHAAYGGFAGKDSRGPQQRLTVSYRATSEDLAADIPRRRDQDIAVGTTTAGPHRDDWTLLLGNRPLGSFGSGGEYRSALLAFRLAEVGWLTSTVEVPPVLLLDDVFSELDQRRSEALLAALPDGQTIITTPSAEVLPERFATSAKVLEIIKDPKGADV